MVSSTRQRFNQEFRRNLDAGNKTFDFEGKTYSTKMAPDLKRDMMPPAPKAGKIESSDLPDLSERPPEVPLKGQNYSMPGVRMGGKGEPAIVLGGSDNSSSGYDAKVKKMREDNEARLRSSTKAIADSDLTPKTGQRPTDSSDDQSYRKGGVVKKKAGGMMKKAGGGSIRGCGIATKGRGKMRVF